MKQSNDFVTQKKKKKSFIYYQSSIQNEKIVQSIITKQKWGKYLFYKNTKFHAWIFKGNFSIFFIKFLSNNF